MTCLQLMHVLMLGVCTLDHGILLIPVFDVIFNLLLSLPIATFSSNTLSLVPLSGCTHPSSTYFEGRASLLQRILVRLLEMYVRAVVYCPEMFRWIFYLP